MSTYRSDLVVVDSHGESIAIVEVKNMPNLSSDQAAEIRQNLLEYGLPDKIPYFLLLSQDVGFLWKNSQLERTAILPTYDFSMNSVIERYLKQKTQRRLYESELELLVLQWLLNLSMKPQREAEEPEKTLAHSGFSKDIQGASILLEQAV